MKKVAIMLMVLVAIGLLGYGLFAPGGVHAQTVDQANAALVKTESRLASAVTKSTATAQGVQHELETPDHAGLPTQLQDFGRTTQRLRELQEELAKDVAAYEQARTATMTEFEQELRLIKDATTRRHMERLRTRANNQLLERLTTSRAALGELQQVLVQGEDLTHAARCVQLATDLDVQGQDLQAQVQRAKEQVAGYGRLTITLLAALTKTNEAAE